MITWSNFDHHDDHCNDRPYTPVGQWPDPADTPMIITILHNQIKLIIKKKYFDQLDYLQVVHLYVADRWIQTKVCFRSSKLELKKWESNNWLVYKEWLGTPKYLGVHTNLP